MFVTGDAQGISCQVRHASLPVFRCSPCLLPLNDGEARPAWR